MQTSNKFNDEMAIQFMDDILNDLGSENPTPKITVSLSPDVVRTVFDALEYIGCPRQGEVKAFMEARSCFASIVASMKPKARKFNVPVFGNVTVEAATEEEAISKVKNGEIVRFW